MHRLAHVIPYFKQIHADHHKQISDNTYDGLNWKNLFLYFDSPKSTLDQWYTEVIPTMIMSLFFGWWLFVLYYIWAAFIQEAVEHNPKFNFYPIITSGKWHLMHHKDNSKNFGVFFPIWDILFKTWKPIDGDRK
jgi:sterol desaturase/sphingolipid hydroxylase (fatty acid hydroxylase superfamily)